MTTEEKDAEIERLKGEMAEALLLMEQGRECLRQLVALSNVNAETRKMLRYLGNTFNLFLQKHTPPPNCGSAAAGESPSHSGGEKHEGDCSIYCSDICDCGALRRAVRQNGIADVAVWERWAKHEKAVSAHAIAESVKHEKGEK